MLGDVSLTVILSTSALYRTSVFVGCCTVASTATEVLVPMGSERRTESPPFNVAKC